MNKHGQTLVLFVVLFPIIIVLLAIIVDMGITINKKMEYQSITKMAIKSSLNHNSDLELLKEILLENEIDISNLEVEWNDGKMKVQNKICVSSVFGSIIGLKNYNIKIKIVGYLENGKIVFE